MESLTAQKYIIVHNFLWITQKYFKHIQHLYIHVLGIIYKHIYILSIIYTHMYMCSPFPYK